MENFSEKPEITNSQKFPVTINIPQYVRDHTFIGKTVIPAVDLCSILSTFIKDNFPDLNNLAMYNAVFGKFIEIGGADNIEAVIQIENFYDSAATAKLLTKTKSGNSGIIREKEHVTIGFRKGFPSVDYLTMDAASALEGICSSIPSEKIYKDLVPFGPYYHNIKGNLFVSEFGAVAHIKNPDTETGSPLGSPFLFDAAFHAACVWTQVNTGITVFPVEFKQRIVINPSVPGGNYFARIIPKINEQEKFYFDIWIYHPDGSLCEIGIDVMLRDVNNGKLNPPGSIVSRKNNIVKHISDKCDAFSIIELDTISEFADKALSPEELERMEPMKHKRIKSYLGARLACKHLSRKLSKENTDLPANQITTFYDKIYPACPMPDGSTPFNCTVSHDSRFAVAAASRTRIGIDIEEISDTVIKAGRIYMNDEDKIAIKSSQLEEIDASLRVWSIKEAVTKALKIDLSASWKKVQVTDIQKDISTFLIDNAGILAYHSGIDNHLLTFVEFED